MLCAFIAMLAFYLALHQLAAWFDERGEKDA
jgi:hypothetical protein